MIAVTYVAATAALGLLASRYLPVGAAVLLATGAALVFQPAQRKLERLADRWVHGARLDGYEVLSRFGAMLEAAPGPRTCWPSWPTRSPRTRPAMGLGAPRPRRARRLPADGRRGRDSAG